MKTNISGVLKQLTLTALLVLSFSQFAEAGDCKKGKACGNSCIAQDAVCSKEAAPAKPAKECKKGKPCGNSCIAKDAVCTK